MKLSQIRIVLLAAAATFLTAFFLAAAGGDVGYGVILAASAVCGLVGVALFFVREAKGAPA